MIDQDTLPTPEKPAPKARIVDLLPRYHEVFDDPEYSVVELIKVFDHEVAWMQYAGAEAKEGEGPSYFGHELVCECDLTEGVGWEIDQQNSTAYFLDAGQHCPFKRMALVYKHDELRTEYERRGVIGTIEEDPDKAIEDIIFDLIQRSMDHEFIELDNGANFWGGYFYIQTIESITGYTLEEIVRVADRMVAENKIKLNGAVIQGYCAEDFPRDYLTIEIDDWSIMAAIDEEKKQWVLFVTDPEQEEVELRMDDPMEFFPSFATGPGDLEMIRVRIYEILEEVIKREAA